ncbi:MAG: PD-(D/E)XK nuclease family protein [bacterium]
MADTRSAVWVSYSSISDFLSCPRGYWLRNIYKNPKTGRKMSLVSPPLSLGQTVHNVVEGLSLLPVDKRFSEPLHTKFEKEWAKVSGRLGGFENSEQEERYKKRGLEMIARVSKNPGPLKNLAIKIPPKKKDFDLPYFWLSEKDKIILCGKIDWLEYLPQTDSVHIIDFKTSRNEEGVDSLQLPIYYLLVQNTQNRKVERASYWYLNHSDNPTQVALPELNEARERVLDIALKVKLARQLEKFKCPEGAGGCRYCRSFEKVIKGEAELVGEDDMRREIYTLPYKPQKPKTQEPIPF